MSTRQKIAVSYILVVSLLFVPATLWADSREITAQELEWNYQKNRATFCGEVKMSGPEGDIECEKMTVLFQENDEIEKILAQEKVKLLREDKKGGGKTIEILPTQDLLIIKGEAWIASDKVKFKGEEITFDLKNDVIKIKKGVQGKIETSTQEDRSQKTPARPIGNSKFLGILNPDSFRG